MNTKPIMKLAKEINKPSLLSDSHNPREFMTEVLCPATAKDKCNCLDNCEKCMDCMNALFDEYDSIVKAEAINELIAKMMKEYAKADNSGMGDGFDIEGCLIHCAKSILI